MKSVFQEIAAASHQAIGAYEVLERMAARGERLAPISIYRAIDALVAAGIVHRFESRNAFFACHAGHEQRQLVLACERCNSVAEVDGAKVFAAIDKTAERRPFHCRRRQGCRGRGVGAVRQLLRQGHTPCAVVTGSTSTSSGMRNSTATGMTFMTTATIITITLTAATTTITTITTTPASSATTTLTH